MYYHYRMPFIRVPISAIIAGAMIFAYSAGCGGSPERTVARTISPRDGRADIVGTWHRPEWDLYRTLYFQADSTAVFDNHIDSLYFYAYRVRGDTLVLIYDSTVVHRSPILKLTEDSLVLGGWPEMPGTFGYARIREKPDQPAEPR